MKIIADSATLFSPQEGADLGMTVIPVCVAINGQTYKDYEEISSTDFLQLIEKGGVPTSSQPSIGDVLDVLEDCNEDTLFLTVGDGLSGAYQTAMGAKQALSDNEHIHIINSKTLAGPLRYLAKKAVALKEQKLDLNSIKTELERCIESSVSFVIPADFEFLKRSGRLTTVTAKIGGILRLLPILTQTKDRTRITPIGVRRSWNAAIDVVLHHMEDQGVGPDHHITVCHAGTPEKAENIAGQVRMRFPKTDVEVLPLSPSLMTHGGPGCIVLQSILK